MIYYLLILIAVVLLAVVFCISKKYQLTLGTSPKASAYYSFAHNLITFLIFWAWSGFSVTLPPFSVLMALGGTVCVQLYTFIGFKLMSYGKYAVYITYLMTGGMMLPFLCGLIFLGEPIRPLRIVGLVCLTVTVVLLNIGTKGEKDKGVACPRPLYILLCAAVFVLNGGISIFNKLHQTETVAEGCERLTTIPYTALSALLAAVICGVWFAIETLREKRRGDEPKAAQRVSVKSLLAFTPWLVLVAAVNGASSFLQLTGAVEVDASVLYPMITGGMIVLSALAGRFVFGERQTKKELILTALCFASTLLFLEL